MPIETFNIDATKDTYVQIGTSVTQLSAHSRDGSGIDVVVLPEGEPQPVVGDAKITSGSFFSFTSAAADIWAKGTQFDVVIEGVRE